MPLCSSRRLELLVDARLSAREEGVVSLPRRGGEEGKEVDLADEESEDERRRFRRASAVLSRLYGVDRGVKEPRRTCVTGRDEGSSARRVVM